MDVIVRLQWVNSSKEHILALPAEQSLNKSLCSSNGHPASQRTLLTPSELVGCWWLWCLIWLDLEWIWDSVQVHLWCGKDHPMCGWHHPTAWGLRLNRKEKTGKELSRGRHPSVSDFWLALQWTWWTDSHFTSHLRAFPLQLTVASLKPPPKVNPSFPKLPLSEFDTAVKAGFAYFFLNNPVALLISICPACKLTYKFCSYKTVSEKKGPFF